MIRKFSTNQKLNISLSRTLNTRLSNGSSPMFGVYSNRIKATRKFSSKPVISKSNLASNPPAQRSPNGLLIGLVIAQIGLLGLCYDVQRNTDSAKVVGEYVPAEVLGALMEVGGLVKPVGDLIIDATGLGASKKKVPTPRKTESTVDLKDVLARSQAVLDNEKQKKPTSPAQSEVSTKEMRDVLSRVEVVLNAEKIRAEKKASAAASTGDETNETSSAIAKEANEELSTLAGRPPVKLATPGSGIPEVPSEKILSERSISSDLVISLSDELSSRSAALKEQVEGIVLTPATDRRNNDATTVLKGRLNHLAGDLFEQITWDSVKSNRSIQQLEMDLEKRYKDLLVQHKTELELTLQQTLLDKEKEAFQRATQEAKELLEKYEKQFQDAMKAQADGFQSSFDEKMASEAAKIKGELQVQVDEQVNKVNKSHSDHMLKVVPKLAELRCSLAAVSTSVSTVTDASQQSAEDQEVSNAILILEKLLVTADQNSSAYSSAIKKEIATLSRLNKDELTKAVLASIPKTVISGGACSVEDLQVRFSVMRDEMRKVALNPDFPNKFLGQLVGNIVATVLPPPKDYLSGPGLEEVLSRAAYFVERGRFREAVDELDKGVTDGTFSKKLMVDWRTKVLEHISVDQSMKVLKAAAIIKIKENVK